ncbi:MAG: copper homeostasis protein CutC [Flavobacterium sp.]
MKRLEIACFNIASAVIAQNAGADRVELCADSAVGGTTPSLETVQEAREKLSIDLYVMIRPRGGDFVYSEDEFHEMKRAISTFKKLGVHGFVFGILHENQTIHVQNNKALVDLAKPFPCTFHRAFDEVLEVEQALEDVIACGFSTVLTSGTFPNVMAGKEVLEKLVVQAQNRIEIMPGGGLRSNNVAALDAVVHANWYHSSAIMDGSETAHLQEIIDLKNKLQAITS